MIVRIEFEGLCLLVGPEGNHNPAPTLTVHALLPDATAPLAKHVDNTDAFRHDACMLIPEGQVADLGGLPRIRIDRSTTTFLAFPIDHVDIIVAGTFVTPPNLPPRSGWTRGFGVMLDFTEFTDDIDLTNDVARLVDDQAIDPGNPATALVTARLRLTGGLIETLSSRGGGGVNGTWEIHGALKHNGGPANKGEIALESCWVAQSSTEITVRLAPFDGSAPRTITLKHNPKDPAEQLSILIGNHCMHPAYWERIDMHCQSEQSQKGALPIEDLDFKWFYKLLESTSGTTIIQRLADASSKLPAPRFTPSMLMNTGSPTCDQPRIQHG